MLTAFYPKYVSSRDNVMIFLIHETTIHAAALSIPSE
ncbi:hypothetical protein SAMN06298216_2257 [Spirosomataceae bacterium TFI 002]|nr:hypothetical protein SAMN06298216_2257 [Spirosomataceae bacterium TFI 002]